MIPYLYGSLSFCQYRLNDSSIVFEVIRTISIFLRKGSEHTKTPHNQKPTTKTETNKSKTTKKQFFTQKTSKRGGGFIILHFGVFLRSKYLR